ncbi:MAG: zinc metallopeptidase [Victivallales bacterium]|nr:zinc metallopeptidase [Victivallales bacterium]
MGYLLFALPGLILSLLASAYVKSTFKRYAAVGASSGLTGAQAAQRLLHQAGIFDVAIEETGGMLSDHYDPSVKTLRLSQGVFESHSLSAIGVACHEAGHAIQHAQAYAWLGLRSKLVPLVSITSYMSYLLFLPGLFLSKFMIMAGVIVFGVAVLFALVTLPVEWDASARAKRLMVTAGIVSPREAEDAGSVLNAAFMTYLAAAAGAIITLLYFLLQAGVFGGGDE